MTIEKFKLVNGLDNNGQPIVNVADPVNAQDVATKNHVAIVLENYTPTASSALEKLSDVVVTDAVTGQVLEWNGNYWVNASANTNIVVTGDATGEGTNSIALTLATVNSNAGTYAGITVNAKGLITSAVTETTLDGYGITDAVNISQLGIANGVATLDSSGKLSEAQVPVSVFPGYELCQNASVTGTMQLLVTYVLLQAGTYENMFANLGCKSPTDTATLIARPAGKPVLATLTNTGLPEPTSVSGFTLESATWVNFYLVASSPTATAYAYGLGIK